jgi:hypothetical protein
MSEERAIYRVQASEKGIEVEKVAADGVTVLPMEEERELSWLNDLHRVRR